MERATKRGSVVTRWAACLLVASAAFAQAPVAASGPDPTVAVTIGLGGVVPLPSGCLPIRIDVAGGTAAFDGVLRLQPVAKQGTEYHVPLTAEPGARRTLEVTLCAGLAPDWRWSLDGSTWTDVSAKDRIGAPLVLVIGEDVGRLEALEEALGGAIPDQSRTVVLAPDDVPRTAQALATAPVILLDTRAAQALPPDAITALRDHVLAGATLIVAGIEGSGLPEDLLAAGEGVLETTPLANRDGSPVEVPWLRMEAHATGRLIEWQGSPRPWLPMRRLGSGRLVRLGMDLRTDAVRTLLDSSAWLAAAGLTPASMTPTEVGPASWVMTAESGLAADRSSRTSATPIPPLVGGIYLIAAGLALSIGAWMLGRRNRGPARRQDIALLLAGICVPGFALGLFRHGPIASSTTIIEYWPQHDRARVYTWTPVTHDGEIPLPPGVHVGQAHGMMNPEFPAATFRLGAQPSVEVSTLSRFGTMQVRTEEWQARSGGELLAVQASGPPSVRIIRTTASATHPSTLPLVGNLLNDVAKAAIAGGVTDGEVILEPPAEGRPRTFWIVRQEAP